MHADLVNARAHHDAATRGWHELLDGLSPAQANWQPAPDRWSVAQCLDHVRIVTGAVLPGLEAAVAEARASGRMAAGPYRYGLLGRWFLAAQQPSSGRPARAPASYRPAASELDLGVVAARFDSVQAAFTACLEAADGVDLARVRAPSPVLPLLRLPVGIWSLALPAHALRHLAQARRVRTDERFPAP